jgi:acyl-coenzyme A synthetase/AMP-(fatty) acid ligase
MAHDFFEVDKDDIFSNNSPLHFDLSVFDIFVALKAGASVVIVPEVTSMFPVRLAEFIEKNKISLWNSVPSVLSLLANYADLAKSDFSNLRLILFAGEVFPVKYLRALKQAIKQARFYNIYGQTEANSSTYYLIDKVPQEDTAVIPIGKPFPNFEVFAMNENGQRINNRGEKGELYVRSASVAFGYWDEGEKTDDNFIKNPLSTHLNEKIYRTGDIVKLDEGGNYIFLGRKDHMIKSRGYRIEIGEIETLLSNHPDIRKAIVVPVPDNLIGNRIVVFIVPAGENGLTKEIILAYCSKNLPKYMVPEIVNLCDKLPETSSGKVDRKRLTEQAFQYSI